jgi:hypothetical protein
MLIPCHFLKNSRLPYLEKHRPEKEEEGLTVDDARQPYQLYHNSLTAKSSESLLMPQLLLLLLTNCYLY